MLAGLEYDCSHSYVGAFLSPCDHHEHRGSCTQADNDSYHKFCKSKESAVSSSQKESDLSDERRSGRGEAESCRYPGSPRIIERIHSALSDIIRVRHLTSSLFW
jgi:hypothetical protein